MMTCQVCRDVLVHILLDPLSWVSQCPSASCWHQLTASLPFLKGRSGFAQLLLGLGCLVAVPVVTSDFEPKYSGSSIN